MKHKQPTLYNPNLHNSHLDGDPFLLEGGPVGIFLSHGYTATTAEIRLVAEKFHSAGYTVAAPLLPGHGTAPEDLNKVKWQDWVRAGQAELDRLFGICEQVWIGGESLGGMLALYLASQNPKAAGILLYAPAIRLMMKTLDKMKVYLASPFMTEVPRDSLDVADKWQGYPGVPLKGIVQLLRFQKATQKKLSQVTQPLIVFQGRQDSTVAPEVGTLILNGVSSAVKEHHWMERSSHVIVLDEEHEKVANMSMRFIEENS